MAGNRQNLDKDALIYLIEEIIHESGEAAKVATDYLTEDADGSVAFGNVNRGESTARAVVKDSSFDIEENGETVATFGANKIELGKNSADASIEMCGGNAVVSYDNLNGYGPAAHVKNGLGGTMDIEAERILDDGGKIKGLMELFPYGIDFENETSNAMYSLLSAMWSRGNESKRAQVRCEACESGATTVILADQVKVVGNPLFKKQAKTFASYSWSSGQTGLAKFSYKPDAIDGYTCIGVVGCNTSSAYLMANCSLHEGTGALTGYVRNFASSAMSGSLIVRFLYAQNGII